MPDPLAYVEERVGERMSDVRSGRDFYRRGSRTQTILAASTGALTTFLIGLDQIYSRTWLGVLALAAAGVATITAAWGGWFGYRRLWVSNQDTLNQLRALQTQIEYDRRSGKSPDQALVDSYFDRYQTIVNAANAEWSDMRSAQP